ncbi:hypothetical protein, partial [Mesorhizobium sp.]|uniref:hypothetical protein n=1 Tax=Mesorhizobium sp. TaxID=1871066 RepID=UPI0025805B6E
INFGFSLVPVSLVIAVSTEPSRSQIGMRGVGFFVRFVQAALCSQVTFLINIVGALRDRR